MYTDGGECILPPQAGQCVRPIVLRWGSAAKYASVSRPCVPILILLVGEFALLSHEKRIVKAQKKTPTEVGGQLARRGLLVLVFAHAEQVIKVLIGRIVFAILRCLNDKVSDIFQGQVVFRWTLAHGCAFVHLFLHRRSLLQGHTNDVATVVELVEC